MIDAQQKDELSKIGLLQICQELHMHAAGLSDPLSDEREELLVEYIVMRMRDWKNGSLMDFGYDSAVAELMQATIEALVSYDERRRPRFAAIGARLAGERP